MNTVIKTTGWKAELKALKYEHIKSTSPGFFEMSGGYQMKLMPYRDDTANGLTKCIIDYINFKGGYANRINTMGVARKERINLAFGNYRDNITYTPSTTNKGTADIKATIRGQSLDIEVKIGRDKLSDHQIKEKERVTRAGGLYFVARDMQSFVDWYKESFTIKTLSFAKV
ncbi:MAG: hypothetical protein WKF85_04135 [Chitinophagaceae bacterium]